ETITVVPEYDEETGRNHNSSKVYYLTATMEGCAEKKEKVTITVNEPITGALSDTTICEGSRAKLDASSFKATKYEWTTPLIGNPVGSSQIAWVTPEVTTSYTVEMSRGNCKAEAEMTVNVNSNPRITSVDSLSYRKVQINVDESFGTAPYYYSVDGKEYDTNNIKDSLKYTIHIVQVKDEVGCMAIDTFVVKRPLIHIPVMFSPNGDAYSDSWEIKGLKESYPEAVVKIFDRWGKLLATYKGEENGWDGSYNGKPMPSTDYWYEINIHEIDKVYTGHFTLIRR
ncbi:MAG: T9SS type B sorting domain-containing protein, partial [Paludibacteraceae bacterium]|nr:T9SS type B sorting domain-containing protein [Paludibacteraceae bacterium]